MAEGYRTFEELIAAEASGYVTVVLMVDERRDYHFARVVGPFPTKREAKNKAAVLRRQFRNNYDPRNPHTRLVGTRVEPLWKELNFNVWG